MKEHALRLIKGQDLKKTISKYCLENNINTAIIMSAVGCVNKVCIRLANASNILEIEDNFEIISLMGTISIGKAHLHISLSNNKAEVIGGHLLDGCLINTTCELVIGELEEYVSYREYDKLTTYDEIKFERKS